MGEGTREGAIGRERCRFRGREDEGGDKIGEDGGRERGSKGVKKREGKSVK